MRFSHQLLVRGGLASLVLLCASCGESARTLPVTDATLEGTVKYKGEPVYYALIIVQGPTASATGEIDSEGRFRIKNVPLGEVKVAVNTPAGKGRFMTKSMSANANKGDAKPQKFIDVPASWHSPNTSGLKTTIQSGVNTLDIDIK